MTGEFDMIARYFAPLTMGKAALDNDTASVVVPDGHQLVVTTDTLNAGVHFFDDTPADIIAQKALRCNLSDLVSSGASPLCYQLAIAFPSAPDAEWLERFTAALLADQQAAGLYCSGGDTTSTKGPLSLTITAMGLVPSGAEITRSGAVAGDVLIVTGAVGEGYAAFKAGRSVAPPLQNADVAAVVRGYARAAIDISDGLLADAGHIARASCVDLYVRGDDIPHIGDLVEAVTGGDDYEVLMAVPAERAMACLQALSALGLLPAMIGECRQGSGKTVLIDGKGQDITPEKAGWQHF